MKKSKETPKPAPQPVVSSDDALDGLVVTLRQAFNVVSAAVTRTQGSDIDLVKQAVALSCEIRKVDVAKRKRLDALTLPMIVAFIRQLDADDRGRLLREIAGMDRQGGVL